MIARLFLVILLLLPSGCRTINGPRARAANPQPVDNTCLPPDEQKKRSRDLIALPDWDATLLPRTYGELPGAEGR